MKDKDKLNTKTTGKNLEEKFDQGEDVLDFFDAAHPQLKGAKIQRVNVDYPSWMVDRLDAEAMRLGISRQALIKVWTAEHLDCLHR